MTATSSALSRFLTASVHQLHPSSLRSLFMITVTIISILAEVNLWAAFHLYPTECSLDSQTSSSLVACCSFVMRAFQLPKSKPSATGFPGFGSCRRAVFCLALNTRNDERFHPRSILLSIWRDFMNIGNSRGYSAPAMDSPAHTTYSVLYKPLPFNGKPK